MHLTYFISWWRLFTVLKQCISWVFNWRNRAFRAFLTPNWHFWQMTQISDKCLLCKTEKNSDIWTNSDNLSPLEPLLRVGLVRTPYIIFSPQYFLVPLITFVWRPQVRFPDPPVSQYHPSSKNFRESLSKKRLPHEHFPITLIRPK